MYSVSMSMWILWLHDKWVAGNSLDYMYYNHKYASLVFISSLQSSALLQQETLQTDTYIMNQLVPFEVKGLIGLRHVL